MESHTSQKDRHLQKLKDAMRLRHYSYSTEKTYCGWVSRFWDAALLLPAAWPREKKIESFLTALAKDDCAASTQNQALVCGSAVCPHDEPLHFHHDGCPACSTWESYELERLSWNAEQAPSVGRGLNTDNASFSPKGNNVNE